jgi:two-component system, NarL family, response regulator NreC
MRILIADDNECVRRGISILLAQKVGYEVCAEATDAADAIQMAIQLRPDLVLLDVSMPGKNGLETARILKQQVPEAKILMISQHDPEQLLPRSLEAGADGLVDKACLASDLLPAIREVEDSSSFPSGRVA